MKKPIFTIFLIGALTFTVGCKKSSTIDKTVDTTEPETSASPEETIPETTQEADKSDDILLVADSELAGEYVDENGDRFHYFKK